MAARPGSATWCRFIGCNNPGASARKLVGGARGLWCGCALLSVTLLIYLMCGTREAGRWVRPRSFAYSADRSASLRSAGSSSRPEPEPYAGTEPTGTGEAEPFGQTGWLEGLDEELGLKLDSEGVPLSVPLSVPLPALQRNPKTALPKSLDARKEGSWSEPSKSKAKEMRRKRRVTGASQPGNGQYSGSLPKKTQLEATVQSKDKRETGDSQAGNDQHTEVMPDTKQSEAKAQKSDGLDTGASQPGPSKVAFMFISRGPMHTDRIWDRFFGGAASNDLYSVYIHCHQGPGFEYNASTTAARAFYARTLPDSGPVERFHISLLDAYRKLLRSALRDAANQWFVLLSDSCIPLRSFAFTYDYLLSGNKSFVDARWTSNEWRWEKAMLPDISRADFKTGSEWSAVTRPHAALLAYEERYYAAFARAPRSSPDEHYPPTILPLLDPNGFEDRTVTHVDWKVVQKGGSPRSYTVNQTTRALLARISSATGSPRPIFFHRRKPEPCLIRGRPAPCYLFARKFPKDTVDQLLELLPIEEGS